MSGYDKFFKDARKASQRSGSASSAGRDEAKFKIKPEGSSRSLRSKSATPEDRLRAELADRIKRKKAQAQRKKQSFPVVPAIIATGVLVICAAGFLNPDLFDEVMDRVEIGTFGKAQAAETEKGKGKHTEKEKGAPAPASGAASAAGENPAADSAIHGEKVAGSAAAANVEGVPNVRGWTDEELSFFKKLNERKKELDLREAELTKLEEELQKQKLELDDKIKKLEEMRAQISQTLKTRVATDREKVDKLVEFYSSMKPQQASKVIESLNEDLAVEVLDKLKKKNAAEIMNMMDAKKARRLSELLTGYQRSPAANTAPAEPAAEESAAGEE